SYWSEDWSAEETWSKGRSVRKQKAVEEAKQNYRSKHRYQIDGEHEYLANHDSTRATLIVHFSRPPRVKYISKKCLLSTPLLP
ncbi:hypothetical protein OESDEN_15035, partial [Oesophagostomum dentatum]